MGICPHIIEWDEMNNFRLTIMRWAPIFCFLMIFVSKQVVGQAVNVSSDAGIPPTETSFFFLLPWLFLLMTPISLYLNIQYGLYRGRASKVNWMVKCKLCPLSEISLRRTEKKIRGGQPRYCTHFGEHFEPHRDRKCEIGDIAIEDKGPRNLYPFTSE